MKDMELYDSFIRETTDLLGAPTQKWAYKERDAWKDNGESELVLLRDAAYELGGGANDAVTFARLVILGVKDIDVENKDATYTAIRNIEFVKYHVFPDGYMMRVSPESSREQIRVSKKAIKKGISFYKVGCDFIRQYKKNPNITNVRVIFITKNVDFKTLHDTAKKIDDVTKTMNTILEGMPEDLDCASCSFKPVCDEVEGLKELHFGKAGKKAPKA